MVSKIAIFATINNQTKYYENAQINRFNFSYWNLHNRLHYTTKRNA